VALDETSANTAPLPNDKVVKITGLWKQRLDSEQKQPATRLFQKVAIILDSNQSVIETRTVYLTRLSLYSS
jgi:hypothetical protein